MQAFDLIVIGGGLLGLAGAHHFLGNNPGRTVCILEKEPFVAQHQSSRNSGVVHSGLFCRPHSLKAYHCRYGRGMLRDFCREYGLPYRQRSKVVIAIDEDEVERLLQIYHQGVANGVDCELINQQQLAQIEPHAAGVAAIQVNDAAVTDYERIALQLADLCREQGAAVLPLAQVIGLQERAEGVIVQTEQETYIGAAALNAAGLHADRIARMAGHSPTVTLLPFRGDYYRLDAAGSALVNGLIYPTPDRRLPFSGIHLTRGVSDRVIGGPNAVLAGGRESYRRLRPHPRDTLRHLASPSVRRLTRRHFGVALWEFRRSWSKELFAVTLQRLVPAIDGDGLTAIDSGIRAQAATNDGRLLDDFVFEQSARMVHVLSAPTPGATAALSIGRWLAARLSTKI